MILYKECTITINGQDFYHDLGWQKVNITVCFLKSKWPDWGDSLYKNVKFCNYLGELYCTALFMFYNDKR